MIDLIAFVLASLLPRNLGILRQLKKYLPYASMSPGMTATPMDQVKNEDHEQYHEEIILADHGILL
jgi:hypothetical protein